MFSVCGVYPVEIRVSRIVGSRRVVCGGGVFGNDVGLGLVIVDACFMHFSIRFGRVDEPELSALAGVHELGADEECTVGEQGQEWRESPPGARCRRSVSGGGRGEEGRRLVVVQVEGGERDAAGEAVDVRIAD